MKGVLLVYDHFRRFGLAMFIKRGVKPSKTERVFFPQPGFFKCKQILSAMDNGVIMAMVENTRALRESHKGKFGREEIDYVALPETSLVVVSEGFVTFSVHFNYLGSWI